VCLWGDIICLCSVGIQRGWKDCFSVECTVNVNHRWCLTGVSEVCRTAIATRGWLGYLFTYETYACHWQGEFERWATSVSYWIIWKRDFVCTTGLLCGVSVDIIEYFITVLVFVFDIVKTLKKGLVIIKPWWEKFHLFVSQNWSDSIPV